MDASYELIGPCAAATAAPGDDRADELTQVGRARLGQGHGREVEEGEATHGVPSTPSDRSSSQGIIGRVSLRDNEEASSIQFFCCCVASLD